MLREGEIKIIETCSRISENPDVVISNLEVGNLVMHQREPCWHADVIGNRLYHSDTKHSLVVPPFCGIYLLECDRWSGAHKPVPS